MRFLFIVLNNSIKGKFLIKVLEKLIIEGVLKNENIHIITNKNSINIFSQTNFIVDYIDDDYSLKSIEKIPKVDMIFIVGWSWIIKSKIILSHNNVFNCHSSLLPDYKGASATIHYWANCEKSGGITIHKLTTQLDEGEIIYQLDYPIRLFDSMHKILVKASEMTALAIEELLRNTIKMNIIKYNIVSDNTFSNRYFFKIGKIKYMYKGVNLIFRLMNINYRFLTPHKLL
jgi:methionyl-tRNA formyltransferase